MVATKIIVVLTGVGLLLVLVTAVSLVVMFKIHKGTDNSTVVSSTTATTVTTSTITATTSSTSTSTTMTTRTSTTATTATTTTATTTTATTSTTTTRTTTTTVTTTIPTGTKYLPLGCVNSNTFGIYNTVAGGNSMASSIGFSVGQYPSGERPARGCDNNITTKYLNFGICTEGRNDSLDCGVNTGFYVAPAVNSSLAVGFLMCTGNDAVARDPMTITLEGSNQNGTNLTLGSSWTLIYSGSNGLQMDPGRSACGNMVSFSNMMAFQSYRLLITSKRNLENSMQFSEFGLFVS